MSRIAYLRVSTSDQTIENQKMKLEKFYIDKFFMDEAMSGKEMEKRKGLNEMIDFVREGDVIYVTSLDRLSRNQEDQEIINAKLKLKGVTIYPIDLMEMLGYKEVPKNNDFVWNIMTVTMNYMAQQERLKMLERQKIGIERAKMEGKYKGGKIKYDKNATGKNFLIYSTVVEELRKGTSLLQISKMVGISRNTVKSIKSRLN